MTRKNRIGLRKNRMNKAEVRSELRPHDVRHMPETVLRDIGLEQLKSPYTTPFYL